MKTAVEWLKEIYYSCNTYEKFISNSDWEQAKEMFEEQIKDAYNDGVNDAYDQFDDKVYIFKGPSFQDECIGGSKTPEKYYKETFKSE